MSALCLVLSSHPLFAGQLALYVFEKGHPAEDIGVTLDGIRIGQTASDGQLTADIGAGSHRVVLEKDGGKLATFDFKTAEHESADASVTLSSDTEPVIAVNTYNGQVRHARGMLRGRIVSRTTGMPLSGASVTADGLNASTVSDTVGHFELELPRGRHEIVVSHPGYTTRRMQDVAIVGTVVQETTVRLSEKTDTVPRLPPMEELNVVATYVPEDGSIESISTDLRESVGVSEILGIDQMLRAGDSNAADALKRVTGLTVQDDKFVVIRGQPERYTQTTWNGSLLPSPDPIRRIVPLDLFPTGSLQKIDIVKSYDAAAPGSFGGSLIGLETAGVPENDTISFSASLGGNTLTTGKRGFDHDGGDDDWLGYDDGSRDLPAGLASADSPAEVTDAARGFSNTWAIDEEDIGIDTGLGFGIARNYEGMGANLGVSFNFDWERKFQNTDIIERDYSLAGDGRLVVRNDQVESRTDMDVNLNGLLILAADWDNHSVHSNTLMLRKSTQRSAIAEGIRAVSQDLFILDYLLEWNERELFAQQFVGEHNFERFEIDWRAMLADSSRYSPDRRDYMYRQQTNGQYVFFDQNRANRRYDENNDDITGLGADVTFQAISNIDWTIDVAGGVDHYEQDRESQTRRYSFRTLAGADPTLEPETLLDPINLGDTLAVSDQTQTNDNYLGNATIDASYLKTDIDWTETLRVVAGVRRENADFQVRTFVAGGSQGGQPVEAGFDKSFTLPSLSVTWRFAGDMQLRLSGGRSLSYPMLNELSPVRYFDPETGEEYLGNPGLEPAVIDSIDGRLEWYLSEREWLSLGVFSKDYNDPIE
ncbi:MAG TPA: TonB-dependent receptor, partial [Gammaproteobacteria bacterium]